MQKKKKTSKPKVARVVSTPAAYNGLTSVKQFSQRSITIAGCDLLANISVDSGSAATTTSSILGSVDLNPVNMIPGGRLSQFAELFDKYQYKELEVVYVPNVGTATSGCLQLAADPDTLDDYSAQTGDQLSQALVGCIHNMEVPVYQVCHMKVRDRKFFNQALYTDPDTTTVDGRRWSSCGQLWWASMGPMAAGTYGRLFIRYKVEFSEPSNDSENSAGVAFAVTVSSSLVTSQYPWGDYTGIRSNFALGSGQGYNSRPFCTFYSDPTLGSVIRFNASGFYLVAIARTGAAMGSGAFSDTVYKNCQNGWPTNDSNVTTVNFGISNGGSTTSNWITAIYASAPGATMSSTGDSGVTHSSAYTFVSKVNLQSNPGSGYDLQTELLNLKKQFAAMFKPQIGSALTYSQTSTTVTKDPSGGPDQVSTSTAVGQVDNGLEAVNVVTPGYVAPKGYILVPRE